MIKEEYISFETAQLAKEKRFNERCNYVYDKNKVRLMIHNQSYEELDERDKGNILCPTQSLLASWLREIRKVNVTVKFRKDIYKYFYEVENIQILEDGFVSGKKHFARYEDAMEDGLQCALNHLRW